jgi:hypothetical protein
MDTPTRFQNVSKVQSDIGVNLLKFCNLSPCLFLDLILTHPSRTNLCRFNTKRKLKVSEAGIVDKSVDTVFSCTIGPILSHRYTLILNYCYLKVCLRDSVSGREHHPTHWVRCNANMLIASRSRVSRINIDCVIHVWCKLSILLCIYNCKHQGE